MSPPPYYRLALRERNDLTSGARWGVRWTAGSGSIADRPLLASAVKGSNGLNWVDSGPAAFERSKLKRCRSLFRSSRPLHHFAFAFFIIPVAAPDRHPLPKSVIVRRKTACGGSPTTADTHTLSLNARLAHLRLMQASRVSGGGASARSLSRELSWASRRT